MCTRCAVLEAEVESLKYVIDEMTSPADPVPKDIPLTRALRRILGALLRYPGRILTHDQIIAASKADTPSADWPDPHCVSVQIYHLRKRVAGRVEITTHHRIGYSARML